MRNLVLLVCSLFVLGTVACAEEVTLSNKPKKAVNPPPEKPTVNLDEYKEFYQNRAASGDFSMTMGLVRSTAFESYKKEYNRPFCNELLMRKLSKVEAIGRIDGFRGMVLRRSRQERSLPSPEERQVADYLKSLKVLVTSQSADFAPLLAEPAKTMKVSMAEPVPDYMYIPFGPEAPGILKRLKNASLPSSVRSGGVSLFLPDPPSQADPPLPDDVLVPCTKITGISSSDGCCHCDIITEFRKSCGGFAGDSCKNVKKCCSDSSDKWLDAVEECAGGVLGPIWDKGDVDPPNPDVDPRIWLDTTPVNKIPVGKTF